MLVKLLQFINILSPIIVNVLVGVNITFDKLMQLLKTL